LFTLGPGQSIDVALQPVIRTETATGTWYVAGVADCATVVNEAVETDNVKRRNDTIIVRDIAPDFVPFEVSTPADAAAGEQFPVSVRFGNLGNDVGSTQVRLVISDNPGASPDDQE